MFRIIPTSCTGVRQTFGKLSSLCKPGLNFYIPIIQKIDLVSNRLTQEDVRFTVKTKDNVFTKLGLAVQYKITPEESGKAFFSLDEPELQIKSYIENVVRAQVPTLKLDELFESQDEISLKVNDTLHEKMFEHGYTIVNTLVTEIHPSTEVEQSMNKINATARLKEAAKNEADANYIMEVRQAEADKDRKRLQGEGISQQRLAIIGGYEEGLSILRKKSNLSAEDILNFVTKIQELDTMESLGKSPNCKVLFFPKTSEDITESMTKANEVSK